MGLKQWVHTQVARLAAHRGSIVACVVVVVFALVSAIWLDDKDAWGALGQWAGAFGAVMAVTVALRISQREAELEVEQRHIEKFERELEQARLVVAVIEYPTIQEEIEMHGHELPDTVRITNFSTTHIFHPRVEGFIHQNGGTVTWDVEPEPPGTYYTAPALLASNDTDLVPVHVKFHPPITPDMYPLRTKVILGFTDADGRRWRRFGEAKPQRVLGGDTFDSGGPDWYRANR
jgi:hypothetical protein